MRSRGVNRYKTTLAAGPGDPFSPGGSGGISFAQKQQSKLQPAIDRINEIREQHPLMFGGIFQWAKSVELAEGLNTPLGIMVNDIKIQVEIFASAEDLNNWNGNLLFRVNSSAVSDLFGRLDSIRGVLFEDISFRLGFDANKIPVIESFLAVPRLPGYDPRIKGSIGIIDKKAGNWFMFDMNMLHNREAVYSCNLMHDGSIFIGGDNLPLKGNVRPFPRESFSIENSIIALVPIKETPDVKAGLFRKAMESFEPPILNKGFFSNLVLFRHKMPFKIDFSRLPLLFHSTTIGIAPETTARDVEEMVEELCKIDPNCL